MFTLTSTNLQGMKQKRLLMLAARKIEKIIVHHSATNREEDDNLGTIRAWHITRGFDDVGYHYFIDSKGVTHAGRDENIEGAHCRGQNENSLGICLSGDFTKRKVPVVQLEALKSLLGRLFYKHDLSILDVHVHNEYAITTCPGFSMPWLRDALVSKSFSPDIYSKAIEKFGRVMQLEKFMEEMSECIQALIHHKHGKISDESLRREVVDVYITLQQAKRLLFKNEDDWNIVKKEKLDKLRKAIDEN